MSNRKRKKRKKKPACSDIKRIFSRCTAAGSSAMLYISVACAEYTHICMEFILEDIIDDGGFAQPYVSYAWFHAPSRIFATHLRHPSALCIHP